MEFQETRISGLYLMESDAFSDERGYFRRLYCMDDKKAATGTAWQPAQINHSHTKHAGTIRGMHYQGAPCPEAKIVRCLKGAIIDVVVDLRAGSATFLAHEKIELSGENGAALLIPEGCAHGFQTIEDACDLIYLHSAPYTKSCEGGVRYDDPMLAIDWPLPPSIVSERDRAFPLLDKNFKGLS